MHAKKARRFAANASPILSYKSPILSYKSPILFHAVYTIKVKW